VQILGGMGYMRGTVCERIYREVKVLTIGGGKRSTCASIMYGRPSPESR
jgi:alkylation response protein AidB-like acyl-CoA dehydrogenase